MKRRHIILYAALAVLCAVCPAQGFSAASKMGGPMQVRTGPAGRRTAMRCLSLAKGSAEARDWEAVAAQASLGLSYDEGISDLWYMLAVARIQQDKPRAEVGACALRALELDRWVDYHRDAARILYADILADTMRSADVFAVLDGEASAAADAIPYPYIYSADAEYIRAKAYYRIGTPQSVELARDKVDYARRTYPDDVRFARLFFTYERPGSTGALARRLAEYFVSRMSQYEDAVADAEVLADLEIRAARFAARKDRAAILRSFNARGLRHPLYASLALEHSLLTEKAALDYFTSFADGQIDYAYVQDFLPRLSRQSVRQAAADYFTAYGGVIVQDSTGDGVGDLYVKYSRGRAESLFLDTNQDGEVDWTVTCDFGVPVAATVSADRMDVRWEAFPAVGTVALRGEDNEVAQAYRIVPGALSWAPVQMARDAVISSCTGTDFFFPRMMVPAQPAGEDREPAIPLRRLVEAAYSITVPSTERAGALITFSLLDGIIQLATYTQDGRLYARAQFEKGDPVLRLVDGDGDGVFETTELYAADADGSLAVHSQPEQQAVMRNLFGAADVTGSYYLRMVQVDRGADVTPDFTEEYLPQGGSIASWDTDGDGLWDVRFTSRPQSEDGTVESVSQFRSTGGSVITVMSRDGRPVSVTDGDAELAVSADETYRFFWLGEPGSTELVRTVLTALDQAPGQGARVMVDAGGGKSVVGIRVGDFCYGRILPDAGEGGEDEDAPAQN